MQFAETTFRRIPRNMNNYCSYCLSNSLILIYRLEYFVIVFFTAT